MMAVARKTLCNGFPTRSGGRGLDAAFPPAAVRGRFFYSGFTLLEMLLVLFILGLMATAATVFTETLGTQSQYDDTRQRLDTLRRAIVGDPARISNGGSEVSGFVADMGRLPYCLRELIDGKCADADPEPIAWQLDEINGSGIWGGWRGPYLLAMPNSDGTRVFRDGWANKYADAAEDARNFGWVVSGALNVQSLGKDGAAGGEGLDADYPADSAASLIAQGDYSVNLRNWDEVEVQFDNQTDADVIAIPQGALRLRINYPVTPADPLEGPFPDWTNAELDSPEERDTAEFLSAPFPEAGPVYAAKESSLKAFVGEMMVPAEADLSGTTLTLPPLLTVSGATLGSNSLTVPAGTEIPVPAGTTLTGTSLKLPAGRIIVPPGSTLGGTTLTWPQLRVRVPAGSTLSGTTLAFPSSGGGMTVPAGSVLAGTQLTMQRQMSVPAGSSLAGGVLNLTITLTVPFGSTLAGGKLTLPSAGGPHAISWDASALLAYTDPYLYPALVLPADSAEPTKAGTRLLIYAELDTASVTAGNLAKYVLGTPVGSTLSGNVLTLPLSGSVTLPPGSVLQGSMRVVLGADTVTVPAGSTLAGTTLTLPTGDVLSVPEGSKLAGATLSLVPTLPVPWGMRSLTVVCENDGAGSAFDGDCDAGTSEPVEPYQVKLVPNLAPPAKPSPLHWKIR